MMERKNHQIHLFFKKSQKEAIREAAKEAGLSINSFCAFKLLETTKLTELENRQVKLEFLLEKILKEVVRRRDAK